MDIPSSDDFKRATRADVAKRAGVSVTTVSFVFTGRKSLPEATKERVLKAAEELNYHPDLVARSLRSNSTRQIGLMVPDLRNPYFAEVALGIEAEAREKGYSVLYTSADVDNFPEAVRAFIGRRVDGVVVCGGGRGQKDVQPFLEARIPAVTSGHRRPKSLKVPWVNPNHRKGGELVAEHLLSLGHTRIGIIGVNRLVEDRLRGCADAIEAAGLKPIIVNGREYSYESGAHGTEELIKAGATAIFAGNDIMAMGAVNAAVEMDLSVPGDISIVGFDDVWFSKYLRPPLTTVHIPTECVGRSAANSLFQLINGEDPGNTVIDVELVIRESTKRIR